MTAERIVLDTNVIVAALKSRRGPAFRLLSLVGTGRFDLSLSVPLLFEYEDVLARARLGLDANAVEDVLDYLCAVSIRQDVHFLWRPYLRDPRDDMVLELAVGSASAAIITYNLRDFVGLERFGIRAVSPRQYLEVMGEWP